MKSLGVNYAVSYGTGGTKTKRKIRFSLSMFFIILVLAFLVFIVGSVITLNILSNTNKRIVTATVTEKAVKGEDGKYMVFTKDEGEVNVYEVTDNIFQGRWNASDTYGEIEEGKTYKFTVVGIRSHFWSMYPNILIAEEVNAQIP